MTFMKHQSADEHHYDKESESYDSINEKASQAINKTIEAVLKKNRIKTVADFTCGTGSQVFYLHNHGFEVSGFDINKKMLNIAIKKAGL